jgi:hypothetical protein
MGLISPHSLVRFQGVATKNRLTTVIKLRFPIFLKKGSFLETLLIFKRSDKLILYIDEMLNIFNKLIVEEEKINRIHFGCACGFAMTLMSGVYKIKVIQNKIVYHFFKGNFLNEVFLWNSKIDKNEKIFN